MNISFFRTTSLFFVIFFAILFIVAPFLTQAQANAQVIEIKNPLKYESVPEIIEAISGILKVIALGIGVIMIIWGGIMIMTAAGSEERVTKGKKTLMWTVIGVAIVYVVDFLVGFIEEILTDL